MAKKHRWIGGTCVKCGLNRILKAKKTMAIGNNPQLIIGVQVGKHEQYYEYHDGYRTLLKRPDCR
jgi:hypothetical protein